MKEVTYQIFGEWELGGIGSGSGASVWLENFKKIEADVQFCLSFSASSQV